MSGFSYHSNQIHHVNGNTRENIVRIENGKGVKIIKQNTGNKTTLNKKPLTQKEISNIRKNIFIPGLFKMRPNNKTRRTNRK